jgi:hypothetical protein
VAGVALGPKPALAAADKLNLELCKMSINKHLFVHYNIIKRL